MTFDEAIERYRFHERELHGLIRFLEERRGPPIGTTARDIELKIEALADDIKADAGAVKVLLEATVLADQLAELKRLEAARRVLHSIERAD